MHGRGELYQIEDNEDKSEKSMKTRKILDEFKLCVRSWTEYSNLVIVSFEVVTGSLCSMIVKGIL